MANFTPLLFLRFHNEYNIPLGEIALISTVFYVTQIVVDTLCATIVDRIGYRKSVVISQFLAGVGLVGLATLPNLLSNPFAGILISVIVYAMGSGMIEVLVSPIVEACPFEHKDSVMSLLHSFYCWGRGWGHFPFNAFLCHFWNRILVDSGLSMGATSVVQHL